MSFIGNSPKLERVRFTPLSADPVNPAEGDEFYSDGTSRSEGKWVYKNSAWAQVGSQQSSLNIITGDDSSFEGSIGSWATYADAAGDKPVDGTGGSATLTATRTTTASLVLNGDASLLLTKDAANRQGEGASLDLTVPNFLKGQPAKVRLTYLASANFDFGTFLDPSDLSDVVMYAYDVTNSKILSPNIVHLDGSGIAETQFQVPSDCATVRLILHVATTSALAYTLSVDDVSLAADPQLNLDAVSNEETYTPTFTGLGTVTSPTFRYKRNGDILEISGRFTTGTTTATEARISFPAGLKTLSTAAAIEKAGHVVLSAVTGNQLVVLREPDVDYMTFGLQGGSNVGTTKVNGNVGFGNSLTYTFNARFPIQGWTAGFKTPSSIGVNVPAVMVATKSGGAVTVDTTIPTWTTVVKDSLGAFNSSTGVYTVKVPGDYYVDMNWIATVGGNNLTAIRVNGTIIVVGDEGVAANTLHGVSTILPDLKVGDTITITPAVNATFSSNETENRWALHKIETPAATLNSRKVAHVKDVQTSGTEGGASTSGSYQTRTLNTLEGDITFISLTSNQFTLQPGTYRVFASAPCYRGAQNKIKLRNITDSTDDIIGTTEYAANDTTHGDYNLSTLSGSFTIGAAKTFEIQHRVSNSTATNGYGRAASFGDSEVYTTVEIEKLL